MSIDDNGGVDIRGAIRGMLFPLADFPSPLLTSQAFGLWADVEAAIHAVEVNRAFCDAVPFPTCTTEQLGCFHKFPMNPPFDNGADVEHVRHALCFLERDGILVTL